MARLHSCQKSHLDQFPLYPNLVHPLGMASSMLSATLRRLFRSTQVDSSRRGCRPRVHFLCLSTNPFSDPGPGSGVEADGSLHLRNFEVNLDEFHLLQLPISPKFIFVGSVDADVPLVHVTTADARPRERSLLLADGDERARLRGTGACARARGWTDINQDGR